MVTYLSEGLHFRGGSRRSKTHSKRTLLILAGHSVENFPFWGMEWELPIGAVNGERDYEAIQRAWWVTLHTIGSSWSLTLG